MRGTWWKWLGLAGVMGVAVTGALVARKERVRHDYTPDQVRERLHQRYAQAIAADRAAGDRPTS